MVVVVARAVPDGVAEGVADGLVTDVDEGAGPVEGADEEPQPPITTSSASSAPLRETLTGPR